VRDSPVKRLVGRTPRGLLDPIPLRAGTYREGDRSFRVEHLEEAERWRFHNHEGSPPPNFDFWFGPAEEARLAAVCESLRSNPNSLFVQNLMCMRADAKGGMKRLVGRVLALPGEEQVILPNAPAFVSTLERHFGLSDPDFAGLWPKLCARHEEVFGDKPAAEIQLGGPPDPS
jgi:N-hydroxyarylamine O-acetyltransferase